MAEQGAHQCDGHAWVQRPAVDPEAGGGEPDFSDCALRFVTPSVTPRASRGACPCVESPRTVSPCGSRRMGAAGLEPATQGL
jgi:hypothetical protein